MIYSDGLPRSERIGIVVLRRKQMRLSSEGMRRLTVFLSSFISGCWILFVFGGSKAFTEMDYIKWIIFSIGTAIGFFITYCIIWGIDLVKAGFKLK
ncbi:MAG: hypothetical protein A2Z09_02940 [Nitrospirae bacterium RBG_16_43_8]|nr:MAG: hypothetical protein A2Z09_02940 [Nitrospirae bacterium RBG_16_43_8]